MDRCDPRSRPLATNRAAHRAEKISAAYRNPRHRRQGIPGLRRRATPNTANLLSENRPGVTDAGVSLRRLTSRNYLTLKTFSNAMLKMGLGQVALDWDGIAQLMASSLPPMTGADNAEMAEAYAEAKGELALAALLAEHLIVKELRDDQEAVPLQLLALELRSIYTTNQDNVFELTAKSYGRPLVVVATIDD